MDIENIKKEILRNDALYIYFSAKNCNVCKVLQPKIEASFKIHFPNIKQIAIQSDQYPETSAYFNIFAAPSLLIFFDHKETKRESRHISVNELLTSTKRTYELYFG